MPVTPFARTPDDSQLGGLLERRERRIRSRAGEAAGLASVERHRPRLAAAIDLDVESLRQRVDDGCPDTVQTAGRRVRPAAELAARVQLGEDDLDAAESRARLDVHGDAARAVAHLDAAVGVQDDLDARAVAAERLIDGVVDDLPEAVHEPARVGGPDVHAGALADRLEPLQHLEMMGGVLGGHKSSSVSAPSDTPAHRHDPAGPAYALSEMSPVRGILETNAWLHV